MVDQPPLAFLYDRRTTPTIGLLLLRRAACEEYAESSGYEVAGHWYDDGSAAFLDRDRPRFGDLVKKVAAARGRGREVLVLMFDWARLSNFPEGRQYLGRQVTVYGARLEIITGARTDRPPAGRLTQCPAV